MSDLISRQNAIDVLELLADKMSDEGQTVMAQAVAVLKDLQSAEPERIIKIGQRSGKTLESAIDYLHSVGWLQEHDRILTESAESERKKGKWIEQDDGWDGIYYECSECREAFTLMDGTPKDNLYNFCPNCGADMRAKGNENV